MLKGHHCLIIGSDGTVGNALLVRLRREGIEAIGTSRRTCANAGSIYLDLTHDLDGWQIPSATDVVVNCAAVTGDACRRAADEARQVNVDAVATIAAHCARTGRYFVHLSTDRVFSGRRPLQRADAPFAPHCEYGRQKAEADERLLRIFRRGARGAIVRFAKILSRAHPLLSAWRESLRRGQVIRPFSDMTMSPVSLDFAIEVLARIIREQSSGTFQMSAETDVSYAQFAGDLAEACGAERDLVVPTQQQQRDCGFELTGSFSSLDVSRIRTEMNLSPPTPAAVARWFAAPTAIG